MNSSGNNGSDRGQQASEWVIAPAPPSLRDLAEGCVRFVERALKVKLDYAPETLPLVDHWIQQARNEVAQQPQAALVVAHAAGAYFGEVVRRRYPSWWRAEGDDPSAYRIEFEPVYLSFCPVQMVADALEQGHARDDAQEAGEPFEIDDADREAVAARLAELPPVTLEEFFALSTRLEVIDIAVDAMRARRLAEGEEADAVLRPEDYDE